MILIQYNIYFTDPIKDPTTQAPTTSTTKPKEENNHFIALDFVFGTIGGFAVVITIGVIILLKKQYSKKPTKTNDIEMNSMSHRNVLLNRYNGVQGQK